MLSSQAPALIRSLKPLASSQPPGTTQASHRAAVYILPTEGSAPPLLLKSSTCCTKCCFPAFPAWPYVQNIADTRATLPAEAAKVRNLEEIPRQMQPQQQQQKPSSPPAAVAVAMAFPWNRWLVSFRSFVVVFAAGTRYRAKVRGGCTR